MMSLERRDAPSQFWSWMTPILALLGTMLVSSALFAFLGANPLAVLKAIFWDPVFGEFAFFYRAQLLIKGAPLLMIAIGLSIGFRAGIWNIGAEGQYIVGALCGAGVGLAAFAIDAWWVFPLAVLAGAVGGMLWALVPALMRTKLGVNEILVSLMMVYVAQHLLAAMVLGPMRNPDGMGFPSSRNFSQYPSMSNPELIAGTGMHWGGVVAIIAVLAAYLLMTKHLFGFHVRLSGDSPRAARFAGVDPNKMILICMGTAGALAGLAGLFEVTGPAGQLTISFNVGYGFTAIIVAFLGRLHPFGVMMAATILALTYIGGEIAQNNLGLPLAAIQVFQGMLLFFLLGLDVFSSYRIKWGTRK